MFDNNSLIQSINSSLNRILRDVKKNEANIIPTNLDRNDGFKAHF